jgi:hypothetical protein
MKKCSKCKIEKELNQFYKSSKGKDGLNPNCKSCCALKDKKYYFSNKEKFINRTNGYTSRNQMVVDEYKKKGCLKCGESKSHLICFHHVDPKQKDTEVASLMTCSEEKLRKEIEKCMTLCWNCHYDFHYYEKKNKITIQEYLSSWPAIIYK